MRTRDLIQNGKKEVTKYVEVDTALSLPERMLIARAIMDPMNEPNWKMAQKTPNALPLSFSSG
jgi:hypothetical protein